MMKKLTYTYTDPTDPDKWWFSQQETQSEILLTLHSPANAPTGHYNLVVFMTILEKFTVTFTVQNNFFVFSINGANVIHAAKSKFT